METKLINLTRKILIPEIPIFEGTCVNEKAVFDGTGYIPQKVEPYHAIDCSFSGTFLNKSAIRKFMEIVKNTKEMYNLLEYPQINILVSNILIKRFIPISYNISDTKDENGTYGTFEAYCGEVKYFFVEKICE